MPVLSATLIQISGTSTPSRSRHTITGFCIGTLLRSMPGLTLWRLPARLKFLTEKPPDLIQHLIDQVGSGPGSTCFVAVLFCPFQREGERDQPGRTVGDRSPKQ